MFSPMLSIANPASTVRDHLGTLNTSANSQRKPNLGAVFLLYGLPAIFGLLAGGWGRDNIDIPSLLSAVAVYTGLIFNLSFHVFDKSLSMRQNPFAQGEETSLELVDQLFANVNYTVLIGILTTALLVSMSIFSAPDWISWAAPISLGLVAFLMGHLLMMSGMILKRFRALREALKP